MAKKRTRDQVALEYLVSSLTTFASGALLFAAANYETVLSEGGVESAAVVGFALACVRAGLKPLAAKVIEWLS
jgi:hypothetical protein